MDNSKENKQKGRPKKNNDKEPYRNTVFCNKLNKLFGDSGESQEVAANKFNTTRQTFGNWLAGRNQPDYETLIAIAKYYNVSTDYLLGLAKEPIPTEDEKKVNKVTGLSGNSIKALKELNNKHDSRAYIDLLSILLEDTNLEYLLGLLEAYITSDDKKLAFTPEAAMSVVQNGEKAVIKLAIIDEVEHLLDRIKPIFLNNAIPTEVKLINLLYKKGAISEKERIRQIDDFYRRFYHGEHQGKQE